MSYRKTKTKSKVGVKLINLIDTMQYNVKEETLLLKFNNPILLQLKDVKITNWLGKYNLWSILELYERCLSDGLDKNKLTKVELRKYIEDLIVERYLLIINVISEVNLFSNAKKIALNSTLKLKIVSQRLQYNKNRKIIYNDFIQFDFKKENFDLLYNAKLFSMALLLLDIPVQQKMPIYFTFKEQYHNNDFFDIVNMIKLMIIEYLKYQEVYHHDMYVDVKLNDYGHVGVIYLNNERAVFWNMQIPFTEKLYEIYLKAFEIYLILQKKNQIQH